MNLGGWVRPALVGMGIALALLAGFLLLAGSLGRPAISALDANVQMAVESARNPALTPWVVGVTDLGDFAAAVTVIAVTLAAAIATRRWAVAVLVPVVVGIGRLWATVAQDAILRARPPQSSALIALPGTPAFPSAHSITAMLLYGAIALLLWRASARRWQRALVVVVSGSLVAAVGLSRIYLGAHWPTDVLGAWLLGGAWLAICCGFFVAWEDRRKRDSIADEVRSPAEA